jgi:hypothetical protein
MGLDAYVYCDCVEKHRLKKPHPYPKRLYIAANGSPEIRSVDAAKIAKHDAWMQSDPCKHEDMMADSSELGNMGSVGEMRQTLLTTPSITDKCPVLMKSVIYSGIHTGDHLSNTQINQLALELKYLKTIGQPETVRVLVSELDRLVKSARKLKKPIAF